MLSLLRNNDPLLIELKGDRGSVFVSPSLQGRIFCCLDRKLVHRLDVATLNALSTTEFNNVGGNSLWPAPEGGPFAFNYLPGSDRWLVQPGINLTPASVARGDDRSALIEKRIALTNRKGTTTNLVWRRAVELSTPPPSIEGYGLAALTYRTEDTFEPLGAYHPEDVLIAPWSLEQFPGADGVIAFGKVRDSSNAINFDFYGEPGDRIVHGEGYFTFALGGEDRHQIGISVNSSPELIGALDTNRSILILRRTTPSDGVYFNIADNDQPKGPFSAADVYSVFNGGALGFYELETIGAMCVNNGCLSTSTLASETVVLKGELDSLRRYIQEQLGIRIDPR